MSRRLSQVLSKMTRSLYNQSRVANPLSCLQKQALRGQSKKIQKKAPKKRPQRKSQLFEYLKREHKPLAQKKNIIQLPKRPFGKHQSYNSYDYTFASTHFIDLTRDTTRQNSLEELKRKFQLFCKRRKKVNRKKPKLLSDNDDNDIYPTKAGSLICGKQAKVVQQYQDSKKKKDTNLQ